MIYWQIKHERFQQMASSEYAKQAVDGVTAEHKADLISNKGACGVNRGNLGVAQVEGRKVRDILSRVHTPKLLGAVVESVENGSSMWEMVLLNHRFEPINNL